MCVWVIILSMGFYAEMLLSCISVNPMDAYTGWICLVMTSVLQSQAWVLYVRLDLHQQFAES